MSKWKTVKLGDVAEFRNGYAFKPDHWEESGKRIIRIQNLNDPNKYYNYTTLVVPDKYHVPKGTLLFSWSASLGVFEWTYNDTALLNQHIFKVVPDTNIILKQYLRQILEKVALDTQQYTRGSTMKHINRGDFLNLEIPLPPLDEQKRIAAILDQADEIRRKRQHAINRLNKLSQAIFYDMFGDPVTNPKGWKIEKLGDILTLINGRAYRKEEERSTGTPVLRIQNLNGGAKWFYSDLQLPSNKYCEKGDLLFAWSATFGPYLWWGDKVIYHYHIWKVECGPNINKIFAFFLLKSITEKVKLSGRGISMLHMTKSGMEKWPVYVPPISEQNKFIEIAGKIETEINNLKSSLAHSNNLFASLQHKAFRGEL